MSLFNGVRGDVCSMLGLRSLEYKKDLLRHRGNPLSAEMGRRVTEAAFNRVQNNVAKLVADRACGNNVRSPSKMNWRMVSPGTDFNPANRLREVGLERRIVSAFHETGNQDWWNQVPVASGLYGPSAGKRRAVDLVRRRNPSTYDFVELKLDSNQPLYAAIEILEYGFAWYFSRVEPGIGYDPADMSGSLLAASRVHLSVLAPAEFYCGASYDAFGDGIASALDPIGGDVRLSFDGFKKLAAPWTIDATSEQLRQEIGRLYPSAA